MDRDYQSIFHLGGTQPMSTDIDDVIHAASDLKETIFVPDGSVTSEIESVEWPVICVQESFVTSVDGACHSGPRLFQTQGTRHIFAFYFFALYDKLETKLF